MLDAKGQRRCLGFGPVLRPPVHQHKGTRPATGRWPPSPFSNASYLSLTGSRTKGAWLVGGALPWFDICFHASSISSDEGCVDSFLAGPNLAGSTFLMERERWGSVLRFTPCCFKPPQSLGQRSFLLAGSEFVSPLMSSRACDKSLKCIARAQSWGVPGCPPTSVPSLFCLSSRSPGFRDPSPAPALGWGRGTCLM